MIRAIRNVHQTSDRDPFFSILLKYIIRKEKKEVSKMWVCSFDTTVLTTELADAYNTAQKW